MPKYKNRKCHFCKEKIQFIDYKNKPLLEIFITQYGKIVPNYYNGNCIAHQKKLAKAIKNAREAGLISYTK